MIAKNNPGNIRYNSAIPGVIGDQNGFSVFDTLQNGILGIKYILEKYYLNQGFDTISRIAYKYAPPIENNTAQWISVVSSIAGIPPDTILKVSDLPNLVMAICRIETGSKFTSVEIEKFFKKNALGFGVLIFSAIFGLWILSGTKKGETKF